MLASKFRAARPSWSRSLTRRSRPARPVLRSASWTSTSTVIGANTFWSPVPLLNLGIEVLYTKLDPKGRVFIPVTNVAGATIRRQAEQRRGHLGRPPPRPARLLIGSSDLEWKAPVETPGPFTFVDKVLCMQRRCAIPPRGRIAHQIGPSWHAERDLRNGRDQSWATAETTVCRRKHQREIVGSDARNPLREFRCRIGGSPSKGGVLSTRPG